jgi:hypothetical protein
MPPRRATRAAAAATSSAPVARNEKEKETDEEFQNRTEVQLTLYDEDGKKIQDDSESAAMN